MFLSRMWTSIKAVLKMVLPGIVLAAVSYFKYLFWKVLLLIVFHFSPKSLYKVYKWRDPILMNYMIGPTNRLKKTNNFFDDFLFHE